MSLPPLSYGRMLGRVAGKEQQSCVGGADWPLRSFCGSTEQSRRHRAQRSSTVHSSAATRARMQRAVRRMQAAARSQPPAAMPRQRAAATQKGLAARATRMTGHMTCVPRAQKSMMNSRMQRSSQQAVGSRDRVRRWGRHGMQPQTQVWTVAGMQRRRRGDQASSWKGRWTWPSRRRSPAATRSLRRLWRGGPPRTWPPSSSASGPRTRPH